MTTLTPSSRRRGVGFTLAAASVIALAGGIPTSTSATAATAAVASDTKAAEPVRDGKTPDRAVASCYDLKQRIPSAPSGAYWLITPKLGAPQKFWCDQVTDGGGWVLVGRGREGWWGSNEGKGDAEALHTTPDGTGAFKPVQLPVSTITALIDGQDVSDLTDGVRLRRATTTDGSERQEARFKYAATRKQFSWQFDSKEKITSWKVGTATGTSGTTASFGSGSTTGIVDTGISGSGRDWQAGFAFGSGSRGTNSATSYVWAPGEGGYPRPFTQVYLRPRLTDAAFDAIPDSGTKASVVGPAQPQRFPRATTWGVTGVGAAGNTELTTEVSAMAEGNGVVYVGGNFTSVQRDSAGTGKVNQSYLAAFNSTTGEWISGFRPVLNNQVKALAVLPDGSVAIGGDFSTVNSKAAPAFAVVNPTTGASVSTPLPTVINYAESGTPPSVRSLDIQGDKLYLGGRFTHIKAAGGTTETYLRNVGRLSVPSLKPDSWNPLLDGTVVSVDASADGSRLYAAGYFGKANWEDETERAGAFNTSTAKAFPWQLSFSNQDNGRTGYQQAIKEVGDRIWVGGSEHMLYSYSRSSFELLSRNITEAGGDFQALAVYGDSVMGACHCAGKVYEGANVWPVQSTFTNVDNINYTGQWDAETGKYQPQFGPVLNTRRGAGPWALLTLRNGDFWMGGDLTHSRNSSGNNQWVGGFARFAPRDVTAPPKPSNLSVSPSGTSHVLSWTASSESGVTYEVIRNDRVVATTTSTSATLPEAPLGTRYFVRARDTGGNRSASTPVVVANETAPVSAIAAGSSWTYIYKDAAPAAGWNSVPFTATGWSAGAAPLGWGHSDIKTAITRPATKAPLTSYHRREFAVEDPSQFGSMIVRVRVDDGVAVYVNGTEVKRINLPAGTLTHGTYATAAPHGSEVTGSMTTVEVPSSLLREGTNVVAAEVHSNWRETPSHSFELTADLKPAGSP